MRRSLDAGPRRMQPRYTQHRGNLFLGEAMGDNSDIVGAGFVAVKQEQKDEATVSTRHALRFIFKFLNVHRMSRSSF